MAWTQEKIEATLKSVVERAQADTVFRGKLKQSPKETLEVEAGEAIPEFIRIAIVDQNDADIVITLPKAQSDELSDADLEQVAGGKGSEGANYKEVCDRFQENLDKAWDEANLVGKVLLSQVVIANGFGSAIYG